MIIPHGSEGQLGLAEWSSHGVSDVDTRTWQLRLQSPKAQPGWTSLLHIWLVVDQLSAESSAGAVQPEHFHVGAPWGLALPSMAAGFREGASQEQVFPKTQAETTGLLVTEPGKSRCITSTISYCRKQVTEPAQVQGAGTTQRRHQAICEDQLHHHPMVNSGLF